MTRSPQTKLIYLADTNVGGAQRTMINIVNQWHRNNIDFTLVIGDASGGALAWLDNNIPYQTLNIKRQIMALPKLIALFFRRKPDVVFSSLAHANIIVLIAALLMPFTIKVSVRETNNPSRIFAGKPILEFLARFLYPRAHRVIALSTEVGEELASTFRLNHHQLVTLPNPVDLTQPDDTPLTNALPPSRFIIMVGRLNIQKNLSMLIDAYAKTKDLPTLYLFGSGGEKQALLNQVDSYNLNHKIIFHDYESNVLAWMKAADFFVLPSSWEGFGHVIVEAMSQGCPVIATSCSGPIEIITNNKDGLLIPIGDEAALTSAMQMLADDRDLRSTLGQAAKTRAAYYHAKDVSLRYLNVIEG